MQYTRLGSSGLTVSRICLGCMGLGDANNSQPRWTVDEAHSREILRRALDLGINFFDTAIGYQNGMAYYNVNETDIKKIAPYETGYATARAAQGNAVYVPSGGTWYFEAIMFRIDDACTVAEQAWFAMNQSFCSVVPGGTKIIDTTATTGCLAFCKKIL